MFGRFTQYEPRSHYIDVLSPDREFAGGIDDIPIGRYNVAPGKRVLILYQRDDKIFLDPVHNKHRTFVNARINHTHPCGHHKVSGSWMIYTKLV